MKILMVLMGLEIGGAETHVVELSKELARRGHRLVVASNGGVFTAELEQAGIRHVSLPLNSRSLRKMLRSYLGLKRLIRSGGFDLVHAHARIPAFLCGLLHRRMKFPFITSAHWVFKTGALLNLMTDWGQRTIAVSEDIRAYLMENYAVPKNHITVTINGIDTEKFSPETSPEGLEEELGLKKNAPRIVYVSRIDTDRSAVAFLLIEQMPRLAERYPGLELVIVGSGNDFERLKKTAGDCNRALGRTAAFTAGGRTDINRFVALGDLFVGVSRAALEAMSAAKPVIIAGNEGYIGLFDEERLPVGIQTNFCCRGCVMPGGDLLYNDVVRALDTSLEERRAMGAYNRGVVLRLYAGRRMADDCERAYRDLLSIDRKRPHDIMISGYYGYQNAGDDSLLHAIISRLTREKPTADITVLSIRPRETAAQYGVQSLHRFNLPGILRRMRRTKLLISGGGSLVQDATSTKSILYYLCVISAAKKMGMRVMVYASGIGPVSAPGNRRMAGRVLSRADLITLRDPASREELRALGVTAPPVHITADPAFSLSPVSDGEIDALFRREGLSPQQKYFAVSVRPWKKAAPDFAQRLALLCDHIYHRHGLIPLFIPMQPATDCGVSRDILNRLTCPGRMLGEGCNVFEIMGLLSRMELVIAMRLHTLIYGAAAGVPLLGLSYDPKVDSVLRYLEQPYKESAQRLSVPRLEKAVEEIVENREGLRGALRAQAGKMREKTALDARLAIGLLDEK